MTQEEIIEGNKLIALFVGRYKDEKGIVTDEDEIVIDIKHDGFSGSEVSRKTRPMNWDDLKYHTSWDWLMPVVEKIELMGYDTKEYIQELAIKEANK